MSSREPEHSSRDTQFSLPGDHRLGVLGGSFNPLHNGHLTIANLVCKRLRLDRVLFIPTGDPPHKPESGLAPASDRLAMVRLAIQGFPKFVVSEIEVLRAGKSYSIDTVRELRRLHGPSVELFFIIGLDAFLDFPNWKEPQALLQACRFVVVPRPGQSFRSLAQLSLLPKLDSKCLDQLDGGGLAELDIPVPMGPGIICLPLPPCSNSSSAIRQAIKTGATWANQLPPPVESYILHHRLYQEDCYRTHV